MSKDKKKKPKGDDKVGKANKAKSAKKTTNKLQSLAQNPLVADIVAAALVGMASALKDSDKARKLATKAGDELDKMAKTSAKQGGAMWDLALNIGRQTLDSLADEGKRAKKAAKPRKSR